MKPEPITDPCEGPRCYRPGRAHGGDLWLCWGHLDQWKRHRRLGVLEVKRKSRFMPATPRQVERARAELAAKGIHVTAGLSPATEGA